MKNDEELRASIMWRVRALYCVRCAKHPLARWAGFVAALAVVVSSVSVKNIAANTLNVIDNPLALLRFFLDAIVTTEVTVQIFTLLTFAFFAFVLYDATTRLKDLYIHQPVRH